jgi:CysZ protein
MDTVTPNPGIGTDPPPWVTLRFSLYFLFSHPRLLGWSLILVVLTGGLTWLGYLFSVNLINQFTGSSFTAAPVVDHFWHWPLLCGWTAIKWIVFVISRVVAFYLAFVLAYCLTTPGYVFLSTWAGNVYTDNAGEGEAGFTLTGFAIDLLEGAKIGGIGLLVTFAALLANFIPVFGQVTVFILYVYYSALMFVDFPASRYRWSLGQKLRWVRQYRNQCFRLGLLPALISMIPVLNVFLMALLLPLFTIHTTLNFLGVERKHGIVPLS